MPHRHVRGAHDGVAKSTQPARHERRDSGLYRDLGQAHRYVGVFGIAIANVALLLGLYRSGYEALVQLVMLTVHLMLVVVILQCRRLVADVIRSTRDTGMLAWTRI